MSSPSLSWHATFRSWSSACAEPFTTNIWDVKFPYCVVPQELLENKRQFRDINAAITALIAEDLQQMMRCPIDEEGRENGDFVRVGFLGVKADWKARREIHHLTRHYGCTWLCDRCWACKGRYAEWSFHNFSLHAPWRAFYDVETASPWYAVPGAHWQLFVYDLMHVLYLGCS